MQTVSTSRGSAEHRKIEYEPPHSLYELCPDRRADRKHERNVSLDDVEETETSLWLLEQLNRIQELVVEHGADDEMLEAVEYLIEDNDRWINPKTAMLLGSQGTGKA